MPVAKITELPAASSVTADDVFPIVNDPTGTPETQKATISSLLSLAWPVGSVFTSVVATNPATLLGFGTWVAFGTGRVLVGLDTGQVEFNTLEETGGANTVTLTSAQSGLPAHGHGVTDPTHNHTQNAHNHGVTDPTHNHTQNPHAHVQSVNSGTTGALSGYTPDTSTSTSATSGYSTANATATNNAASTGVTVNNATATNNATTTGVTVNSAVAADAAQAHNNLQPYIVVNFWKRTA